MNLAELIEGLAVRGAAGSLGGVRVCDITDDSRTALPGSLFIARAGTKMDGRKFIPDALKAGAVAVLTDDPGLKAPGGVALLVSDDVPAVAAAMAERFYGNPSARLELVGITGTNGKTTTAHLVHQMLNGAGVRCGLIGTVEIDDGREVAPAVLTTPPATELSRTFAVMLENGCKAAAMEVSSHALDQSRVGALKFDIGVFTNLTGDHLDYHGTMEAYGQAKAKLFAMLPPSGWAVINAEDPAGKLMAAATRAQVMWCGVGDGRHEPAEEPLTRGAKTGVRKRGQREEPAARGTILEMTMMGTVAEFAGPWGKFEARMSLIGRHNVMNALQAIGAAWAAGVQPAALPRLIRAAKAPPGRLEPVTEAGDPFAVLVDYAHSDDALRKVLGTLRPLVGGRKTPSGSLRSPLPPRAAGEGGRLRVVFGCGGDRDRTKRARMGAAAAELADAVYVTSDNPRTERPSAIIDEILAGIPGEQRGKVSVDADRGKAIERAIGQSRPGDLVLIAGKGHETYQIVPDGKGGTVTNHFDDREVARAALGMEARVGAEA